MSSVRPEDAARVDVLSEAVGHSILGALSPPFDCEWRATGPGPQIVRLQFIAPQHIRRVRLVFEEREHARMQEFTLAWLDAGEQDFHTIVRQQFNFAPSGATREVEDYEVVLRNAAALELRIVPAIGGVVPARAFQRSGCSDSSIPPVKAGSIEDTPNG